MRIAMFAALMALSVSSLAAADPAQPAATHKKLVKPIVFDPQDPIVGHRDVPVAFVKARDNSIRNELDTSVDQHIMDSAQSR